MAEQHPDSTPPPEASAPLPRDLAYGAEVDEVHILDYLKVLHKRRWTAIPAFLAIVLGVSLYTFSVTPLYEAQARLLIEPDNPNIMDFRPVMDELQTNADYYQTQYALIQSRALARHTLEAVGWDALGGDGEDDVEPDITLRQAEAIDDLLDDLTVSPVRNSRLVDVTFRSRDPELSAEITNTHAQNYVDQNIETRLILSQDASGWLGTQLEDQRQEVEDSERALQRYLETNRTVGFGDGENIVLQRLGTLNDEVTRARTTRIGIETRYNRLRSIQHDRAALDAFPAILNNPFIQTQKTQLAALRRQEAELSERFGDRHPTILEIRSGIDTAESRIEQEIRSVVSSVEDEYLAAQTEEATLERALEAQKIEALGMNEKEIEYGVLQRDVDSNREVYEAVLQRAKETDISGDLLANNIRIVDVAEVPHDPVSPRKALNLLLALLGGGMLSIGLAFFFEYVDTRIKTLEEVKVHLGLPGFGLVPAISPKTMKTIGGLLVSNGVPPSYREAFSGMRTNLLFSSTVPESNGGQRSILVTSTGPAEGKTSVASNLATSLAQAQQRVLLVDADLRRPTLDRIFKENVEPGLSNLTAGTAKAEQVIRQTSVPGLWLLPAGATPENPAELLASQTAQSFFGALPDHFDWVIIDTPPVLAVSDVLVLAPLASGVLFVVGAEMTTRDAAQAALERLEAVQARFLGAVLNRVPLERNSYYYSRYYRREYTSYYTRPPVPATPNARSTGTLDLS